MHGDFEAFGGVQQNGKRASDEQVQSLLGGAKDDPLTPAQMQAVGFDAVSKHDEI